MSVRPSFIISEFDSRKRAIFSQRLILRYWYVWNSTIQYHYLEVIAVILRFLSIVMFCAIWYHVYNLKNVKNIHGGVLLLVTWLKLTLLHGCFSHFLNCTNGTKLRKASHTVLDFWNSFVMVKWHSLKNLYTL